MIKQIFVNMMVKDLEKSREFFTKAGFTFNGQFSNNDAACLVISENIFAMLLTEDTMKRFTKRLIINPKQSTEVLLALAAESREEVDKISSAAIAAGGKLYRETEDYGWMYTRSIEDLDGHIWEIFFMDESKAPKA